MSTIQKISTSIVAFFLFIPGLVKFTEKFKTFFTKQIELSNIPFPELSFVVGQASEIITGALLFSLLFFWKRFIPTTANKLFTYGNLMVIIIMAVALYVHVHPAVSAEILPFEEKFPYLTLLLIVLASINLYTKKRILKSKTIKIVSQ